MNRYEEKWNEFFVFAQVPQTYLLPTQLRIGLEEQIVDKVQWNHDDGREGYEMANQLAIPGELFPCIRQLLTLDEGEDNDGHQIERSHIDPNNVDQWPGAEAQHFDHVLVDSFATFGKSKEKISASFYISTLALP